MSAVSSASAATVQYSGKLFAEFGPPVVGGEVIIGTFAPSFDPSQYNCVYGDESCNQVGGSFGSAFDSAVGEGNFFPIGFGAVTEIDGSFSGFGNTAAPAGTQIWLFAFENLTRNSFYQVLASSTDPAWQVPTQPNGFTAIVASQANIFVMGFPDPEGVRLNVVPFPEPAGMAMLGLGMAFVGGLRVRWRCTDHF